MPVDFGYSKIFCDVFLRVFALAYLVLFVCRILAATVFPRFCDKRFYWLVCLLIYTVYFLLSIIGGQFSIGVAGSFLLLFAPSFILGAIEMARRWRWHLVLLSCVLETLLFPMVFVVVFCLGLLLEGGD